MGSDKSKKKTTVNWVILGAVVVVAVIALAIGGYFLYQNVIRYMIWPEKPPAGEFDVVLGPGGVPTLVPKPPRVPGVPGVSLGEPLGGELVV